MELALGVAVTGAVARLALIDASAPDSILDESVVDVSAEPTQRLASTIAGTDRDLSAGGHRLAATAVCWADQELARGLSDALTDAGVRGVHRVSTEDAATAFVRKSAASAGQQTSALLLLDNDTAALSIVGADAATTSLVAAEPVHSGATDSAVSALFDRLAEEPAGSQNLYALTTSDSPVLSDALRASAPVPVRTLENPAFVIARGAALAGVAVQFASGGGVFADAAAATAGSPQLGEHLAYSMADDGQPLTAYRGGSAGPDGGAALQTPMAPLSHTDDAREADGAATPTARPRVLLLGSTIAAIVIVGFSVLAVGVAIGIKPTVSQQAVRESEAVPGKYLPVLPGQGTAPIQDQSAYLPPVVPVSEPAAGGSDGSPAVVASGGSGGFSPAGAPEGLPSGPDSPPVAVGPPDAGQLPALPMPEPPPGGFKLGDWLPQGLNINVGQLFSDTHRCKDGDIACFVRSTGCAPKDSACLTKNFECANTAQCEKTTAVTCQSGMKGCDTPATVCPSGAATCQPIEATGAKCSTSATCPPAPPGNSVTAATDGTTNPGQSGSPIGAGTPAATGGTTRSSDGNSGTAGGTTSSGGKDAQSGGPTGTSSDVGTAPATGGGSTSGSGGTTGTSTGPASGGQPDSSVEKSPPLPAIKTTDAPVPPPAVKTTDAPVPVITTTDAPVPPPAIKTTDAPVPPPVIKTTEAPVPPPVIKTTEAPVPPPAPEPQPAPEPAPKVQIPVLPAPSGGGSTSGSGGSSSSSGSGSSGSGSGSSGSGSSSGSSSGSGFCLPLVPCTHTGS